jgi:hypothetical protein
MPDADDPPEAPPILEVAYDLLPGEYSIKL